MLEFGLKGGSLPAISLVFIVFVLSRTAMAQNPAAVNPDVTEAPSAGQIGKSDENNGIFVWDDHPTLRLGRATRISFRARFGSDIRGSNRDREGTADSAFDLVRRRIAIEGRLFRIVDFQIERELVHGDPWRDVYVNYRQFAHLQVQAGKFKLPFSLDENTSSTNLDFIYRSLAANQLAPGRDRGVMVHGDLLHDVVTYEGGVFDHDGRNARSPSVERVFGGSTIAGRITAQPFRSTRSAASDFQAGIAVTRSRIPVGLSSLRGRTALDTSFYVSDQYVQGHRQRIGFEGRWRPGPFSVKAEYMRAATDRQRQSVEDTDLPPLLATGWYVSGSWAITGGKKSEGLDTPRHPVHRGGVGAVELAARVERLAFGSTANGAVASSSSRAHVVAGASDRALTTGVNWYPNRWVKVQFNAIHETLTDARHGAASSTFWSHVLRLQLTI